MDEGIFLAGTMMRGPLEYGGPNPAWMGGMGHPLI